MVWKTWSLKHWSVYRYAATEVFLPSRWWSGCCFLCQAVDPAAVAAVAAASLGQTAADVLNVQRVSECRFGTVGYQPRVASPEATCLRGRGYIPLALLLARPIPTPDQSAGRHSAAAALLVRPVYIRKIHGNDSNTCTRGSVFISEGRAKSQLRTSFGHCAGILSHYIISRRRRIGMLMVVVEEEVEEVAALLQHVSGPSSHWRRSQQFQQQLCVILHLRVCSRTLERTIFKQRLSGQFLTANNTLYITITYIYNKKNPKNV